jgi:hypothetical protein
VQVCVCLTATVLLQTHPYCYSLSVKSLCPCFFAAVVELKFSSQKKHPTHSTRHASRGVCARSRCKHWAGRLQVYTSRFHFQTAAAACLLFCQPPPFPLLSFPMSSYWSKACSAQLNLTLLQLQRANYGCCMSSVSKVETVCAALQS